MAAAIGEVCFWAGAFLLLYTYALYPALLMVLRAIRRPPAPGSVPFGRGGNAAPGEAARAPFISVIVSVYNERRRVEARLRNLRETRHPADRMEILVGSDGSDDGTDEELGRLEGGTVRVFLYPERRGKSAVLNDLVKEARGTLLVFTDANTVYEPDTIPELLAPFDDPAVGGVCGELVLAAGGADPADGAAGSDGEASYWSYENHVKRLESDIGTILGATGAVYAIRAGLYPGLPVDRLAVDDFLIPLGIIRKGHPVKYNPRARASEPSAGSVAGEFRRKVRIGTANFFALREFADLLHPRRGFVAFALWSHKVIRWFAPLLLLVVGAASLLAMDASEPIRWMVGLEAAFLAVAAAGFAAERLGARVPLLVYPYYFLAMNAALLVGMVKFLLDVRRPHWDVVR